MGRKKKQVKRLKKQRKRERAQRRRSKKEKEPIPFHQSWFFTLFLLLFIVAAPFFMLEYLEGSDYAFHALMAYLAVVLATVCLNKNVKWILGSIADGIGSSDYEGPDPFEDYYDYDDDYDYE